VVLLYATAALTFAYSLRFTALTFFGKKSEHLEKLHVHEAPKIMLLPAAILAVLCVAWGFVEPWLGGFMRVEGELSLLGAFFSLETPIFLAILAPVGLIIYLTYYKNSQIMMRIRSSSNYLTTVLKHGYFFDDLYERIVGKGIVVFSEGVRRANDTAMNGVVVPAKGIVGFANVVRHAEVVFFERLPQLAANSIIRTANAVHKYLDVLADELLSIVAHRTLRSASQMKKVPSSSLQHYIAAALLGFLLILILIIITIGV
jgi:NADH:ubiquinone oxidoreductase subunit 5 (subunit L)/multisubunit Na+/H+ antiporter MnhA subunit